LNSFNNSFQKLVDQNHKWFTTCIDIDYNFDIDKFESLFLTLLKDCEGKESPEGTFYIFDGVHRSIVLAKKLLIDEIEYTPINAYILVPRRN